MRVVPIKDFILVRQEKDDHHGIILTTEPKPVKGEVVDIGPGWPGSKGLLPMDVKIGDTVTFLSGGPDIVQSDGEELLLMRQGYVLAVEE